jgi:hypothetical protein
MFVDKMTLFLWFSFKKECVLSKFYQEIIVIHKNKGDKMGIFLRMWISYPPKNGVFCSSDGGKPLKRKRRRQNLKKLSTK